MTQLHAPDAMGAAAHKAAMHVSGLDADLLTACGSAPGVTREDRAEALARALRKWPALCRAMSELQASAPHAARQAQERDEHLRDFVEARS